MSITASGVEATTLDTRTVTRRDVPENAMNANAQTVHLRTTTPFRRQSLRLNAEERWAIVGKTGGGKSQLAFYLDKRWLRAGWPILIIDVKHRYVNVTKGGWFAEAPSEATLDHPYRITGAFREDAPVQIYLPSNPAKQDETLNRLFFQIIERGGVVVHIEDMVGLADAHTVSDGTSALWTLGRAAEVPVLALVQKARNVPPDLFSQSENIAVFRLPDIRDRTRMEEVTGAPEMLQLPARYQWWYWHEDYEHAVKMDALPRSELRPAPRPMTPRELESRGPVPHGPETHRTSRR